MKKFVVLATICTVSACGWNKPGPIFPDMEGEEIVRYEGEETFVNAQPTQAVIVEQPQYVEGRRPERKKRIEPMPVPYPQEAVEYVYVDEPRYMGGPERVVEVEEFGFSPEVYSILATRSTNKLIDETADIHENRNTPTIYVMKTNKANEELPNGTFYADRTTKNILNGSKTYNVINNIQEADYHVQSTVDVFSLEGRPVIQYKTILSDKNNEVVKEWVETIQQVTNDDRTWW